MWCMMEQVVSLLYGSKVPVSILSLSFGLYDVCVGFVCIFWFPAKNLPAGESTQIR